MHTNIITTIGPATQEAAQIAELREHGASIARLNFTHGTYEWFSKVIGHVHALNAAGKSMAILLDTKGPEIRTAADLKDLSLEAGKTYSLGSGDAHIRIDYDHLAPLCDIGQVILLDGGNIQSTVTAKDGEHLMVTIRNSGILKSKKHINVPGIHLDLPILSKKDQEDIAFGIQEGIHYIAASFVSTANDIATIKSYVASLTDRYIPIIAKIESQTALDNLDGIIASADGIMIARGDLAVETSFEVIPVYQKLIITKCRLMRKPVIMATQMLASMVDQPSPTRAEASDVGNAIYDGVDAIMLSDETTIGKYPTVCVDTMRNIANLVEQDLLHSHPIAVTSTPFTDDMGISMLASCRQMASGVLAQSIVLKTNRRDYVTYLSQERLKQSIIVLTDDADMFYYSHLLYGVTPVLVKPEIMGMTTNEEQLRTLLLKLELAKKGDRVIAFTDNDGSEETFDALYVSTI